MKTQLDKVRSYYSSFDEWGRLDSPEGTLELRRVLEALDEHLVPSSRVLDLGGGPGRYAMELAQRGHRVVLADISPELLTTARERLAQLIPGDRIESIDEVNATDLSRYPDESFDAVLALGPFYHLVSEEERRQAVEEIWRVLRRGGIIFAVYIPRTSGIVGLISRAAARPDQVTQDTLRTVARTGAFRNASSSGFQEGFYAVPGEIERLFETAGCTIIDVLSLRSISYGLAVTMEEIERPMRNEIQRLASDMSRAPEIIGTCGHVLVVARRK